MRNEIEECLPVRVRSEYAEFVGKKYIIKINPII
jgi:hypothetical protein